MTELDGFLVAVVGFMAAIAGGLVQAWTSRNVEEDRFRRSSKADIYSAFFETLGELSFTEENSQRHVDAKARMANLRGKIGVHGSKKVVGSVGEIFRHPSFESEAAQEAMTKALSAMRADLGQTEDDIDNESMRQLMFGSRDTESFGTRLRKVAKKPQIDTWLNSG